VSVVFKHLYAVITEIILFICCRQS